MKIPKFFHYFVTHIEAFKTGWSHLMEHPMATLMTVAVIGMVGALPAAFFVLLDNAEAAAHGFDEGTQISLFLTETLEPSAVSELITRLKLKNEIAEVRYISKEAGLKELESQEGLGNVLSQLSHNPLPAVIEVAPAPDLGFTAVRHLLHALQTEPGVESAKLDMQWIERLHAILSVIKRLILAITLLLAMTVLLVVGNTVRLATQRHHKEMKVLQLIGATDPFIRRPFLYAGMSYGALGGILACGLVFCFFSWLTPPVSYLASLYHTEFVLTSLSRITSVFLFSFSTGLGGLGAWLAVRSYLRTQHE